MRSFCSGRWSRRSSIGRCSAAISRDQPHHPNVFVTYGFSGALDNIYTTLFVRLNYSGVFEGDQLWKDAADFKTPEKKRVGLAMKKLAEGAAGS